MTPHRDVALGGSTGLPLPRRRRMTHRGVPCRSRTRGGPDDCAGHLPLQARWHEPHAGVVSDKPGVTDRVHIPWARLLIIAGAATMVISAAVGYAWLKRMPELQPVDSGQQAQIRATESTSATIFASTGLSQAPSCAVTSGGGDPVTVGNAQRITRPRASSPPSAPSDRGNQVHGHVQRCVRGWALRGRAGSCCPRGHLHRGGITGARHVRRGGSPRLPSAATEVATEVIRTRIIPTSATNHSA